MTGQRFLVPPPPWRVGRELVLGIRRLKRLTRQEAVGRLPFLPGSL